MLLKESEHPRSNRIMPGTILCLVLRAVTGNVEDCVVVFFFGS